MERLPLPTGPFVVGCVDFMSKSISRPTLAKSGSKSGKEDEQNMIVKDLDELNDGKFGCFMRLFYPTSMKDNSSESKDNFSMTAELTKPQREDEGKICQSQMRPSDRCRPYWLPSPRQLYADGFLKFSRLPSWLLGKFTTWLLGKDWAKCLPCPHVL